MDVSPRQDFVSIEISGATISAQLNQGTISLWFGRNADKSLVSRVLLIISKVDSTAEHEKEVICSFDEISGFENCGYILTSYARKQDKYKAMFLVPFSDQRALERLIDSICQNLGQRGARVTISWSGGRTRMNMLQQELSKLSCFSFSNITYKNSQQNDQQFK